MAKQKNGLSRTLSAVANNYIVLIRQRTGYVNIIIGKTCGTEASRHRFRRGGYVAGRRISGVDLNQFPEDVTRHLLVGSKRVLLCAQGAGRNSAKQTYDQQLDLHPCGRLHASGPLGINWRASQQL